MLIMLNVLIWTSRLAQIARLARGSRQNPKSTRPRKAGQFGPPTLLPEWRGQRNGRRRRVEGRNRVLPVPERATWKPTPMPFAFMARAVMAGLPPLSAGALAGQAWPKLNCERRAGSYIRTRQEGAGLSKKESRNSPAQGMPRRGQSVPRILSGRYACAPVAALLTASTCANARTAPRHRYARFSNTLIVS